MLLFMSPDLVHLITSVLILFQCSYYTVKFYREKIKVLLIKIKSSEVKIL